jgi:hypothetical protein
METMRPENLLMRVLATGERSVGIGGSVMDAIDQLDEGDELRGICAVTIDLGANWETFEAPGGTVELPGAVVGFIDLAMGPHEHDVATYLDS